MPGGDGKEKVNTGGAKPSVRAEWLAKNREWEGRTTFMYVDTKGYVSIGVGNMIDIAGDKEAGWRNAKEQLAGLKFVRSDGSGKPVALEDIRKEWEYLRDHGKELSDHSTAYFAKRSAIQLTDESVDALVMRMFDRHEAELKAMFPDYGTWPAEAQFAVHSMMWALGPSGYKRKFPKMIAALKKGDFVTAAHESEMTPINNKVMERNKYNADALLHAAIVSNPPPGIEIPPTVTLPTTSMMDSTRSVVLDALENHEEQEHHSETAVVHDTIPKVPKTHKPPVVQHGKRKPKGITSAKPGHRLGLLWKLFHP